jgi:2-keto-4-pentenoate hydratase/2-oxohepta-3-ene-1,7-dioic acid hydratase in catechol pathway
MKIICIGRNYADHAKEMNSPVPSSPMFFMKPDTAMLKDGNDFYHPDFSDDIHYECELVVKINKVGKNIQEKFARKYYDQVSLGLDFTARDLQSKCKEKSHPWEIAKAFDNSAAISTQFVSINELPEQITFDLTKNGETVQQGTTADMIFSIDQLIAHVSKFITLKVGDLIYTGTPAGVGSIKIGDKLIGSLEGKKMFEFKVK